jgi:hypothetical protein
VSLLVAFSALVVVCLVLKPCDAQAVLLDSIMNCRHQTANTQSSVCIYELHAACASEAASKQCQCTMCSLYATALQRLQDAGQLDILCISSNPTITGMHDADPSKVPPPMRKTLMRLRVAD